MNQTFTYSTVFIYFKKIGKYKVLGLIIRQFKIQNGLNDIRIIILYDA